MASGKTLVAAMLEVCGAPVAFADQMARGIMEHPGPVRDRLEGLLGAEAYTATGQLDRAQLGKRLFADPSLLAEVNAIVHPAVGEAARAWHEQHAGTAPYTIYESALLFEADVAQEFDVVVLVHAPRAERLRRAMARDGAEESVVVARLDAQWTDEQRLAQSAYLILNDGSAPLISQVWRLHRGLVGRETA